MSSATSLGSLKTDGAQDQGRPSVRRPRAWRATSRTVVTAKDPEGCRGEDQGCRRISTCEPSPETPGQAPADAAIVGPRAQPLRDDARAARYQRCMTDTNPVLAYKGRPLTGIWATPPYLHNGSVPTLYDLLLPPEDRPQVVLSRLARIRSRQGRLCHGAIGRQQLSSTAPATRPAGSSTETRTPGTTTATRTLTEEQRRALVEYMKSL